MRRFASFFADRTMAFGGQHRRITGQEIAITDRALAIISRQRLPEFATRFSRTVAKGKADNPARLSLQSDQDPYNVAFVADKRPQLVGFENRSFAKRCDRLTNRCQDFFSQVQQSYSDSYR